MSWQENERNDDEVERGRRLFSGEAVPVGYPKLPVDKVPDNMNENRVEEWNRSNNANCSHGYLEAGWQMA